MGWWRVALPAGFVLPLSAASEINATETETILSEFPVSGIDPTDRGGLQDLLHIGRVTEFLVPDGAFPLRYLDQPHLDPLVVDFLNDFGGNIANQAEFRADLDGDQFDHVRASS